MRVTWLGLGVGLRLRLGLVLGLGLGQGLVRMAASHVDFRRAIPLAAAHAPGGDTQVTS